MRKREMQRIIDEQQELIDAYRELEWELRLRLSEQRRFGLDLTYREEL